MEGFAASNVIPSQLLFQLPHLIIGKKIWNWHKALVRYASEISLWYLEQGQPQLMCLCLGTVESCTGAQASPDGANKERNKKST